MKVAEVVETEDHLAVENAKVDTVEEIVLKEVDTEEIVDLENAEVQVSANHMEEETLQESVNLMVIVQTEDLQRSANRIATVKEVLLKEMKILLQKKATQKTNRAEEEIEKVISQEKDVLENNFNLVRL